VYNKSEAKSTFGTEDENEIRELYWTKIKNQINKKMPTYKYIKNVIVSTEPLIKTTTNKVKRTEEIARIESSVTNS
jgi:hypothetical protein